MHRLRGLWRLFAWFCLRHNSRHSARALIVLIGVALGAGVFTSVRLSVDASVAAFSDSVDRISGTADAIVLRSGGRVSETILPILSRHRFVESVSAMLTTRLTAAGRNQQPSFLLVGIDPIADRSFRNWRIASDASEGSWADLVARPMTMIAARPLAEAFKWRVGQSIRLTHASGSQDFVLVGILDSKGLAHAEGGLVAVTDIASFQEFTDTIGQLDRIDIRFRPQVDAAAAMASLKTALPKDLNLLPASENRESGKRMIRAYQLNLSILSFVSLFVGMFLVYSLVALNAASRRKEIAILRSIGTPAEGIFLLVLMEGVLFGVFGWLMAIPLGGILVTVFLDGIGHTITTLFVPVHITGWHWHPWELGLSLAVTVGVAVAAALQPARDAMRVPPLEAMASVPPAAPSSSGRRHFYAGATMIATVLPLSRLPGVGGIPLPGYVAVFCLFVGFSLLIPTGLRLMGTGFAPLMRRLAGVSAYLAARYVRDSGMRVAVSVGALITAVALFTALVIMVHSFRQTVALWVRQTVSGDVFVTAKMAESNRYRDPLPAGTMQALQAVSPAVDRAASRRFYLQHDRHLFQLEGIDLAVFLKHGEFIWLSGSPGHETLRTLIEGRGVLISEVFSNQNRLGVGDLFETRVLGQRFSLPVLGIIRDYRTKGGVVFCDLSALQRLWPQLRWTGVRFFLPSDAPLKPEAVSQLMQEIDTCCAETVDMISGHRLRQAILDIFDDTFAVTTLLLVIALIVAALGITTTMTVLVLERSLQLNTLYAVGGSRGQVRRMIFWEACLMLVSGQAAGLACGFILSYLLVFVINRQSFGWTFAYTVDWQMLLLSMPLIAAVALAAVWPALRHVFRHPPATILRQH